MFHVSLLRRARWTSPCSRRLRWPWSSHVWQSGCRRRWIIKWWMCACWASRRGREQWDLRDFLWLYCNLYEFAIVLLGYFLIPWKYTFLSFFIRLQLLVLHEDVEVNQTIINFQKSGWMSICQCRESTLLPRLIFLHPDKDTHRCQISKSTWWRGWFQTRTV